MILACPHCETSFSLPDDLYRPGRKARCSSCGNVFPMPMMQQEPTGQRSVPAEAPVAMTDTPSRKRRISKLPLAILVASVLGVCLGGYMVYKSLSSNPKPVVEARSGTLPAGDSGKTPKPEEIQQTEAQLERVKDISFVDDSVRQFIITNDKMGTIVVIQGKAVNNSTTPKDMIVIEGRLLDQNNKVLAAVQQRAGVSLTLLQLQVLDAKEMQAALNNSVDILMNNTNVPPKGEVPFFIVFTKRPNDMFNFEVRPIAAKESPPVK